MATLVRNITPEDDSRLKELSASDDRVTRWHANCILMSAQGKSTIEI